MPMGASAQLCSFDMRKAHFQQFYPMFSAKKPVDLKAVFAKDINPLNFKDYGVSLIRHRPTF